MKLYDIPNNLKVMAFRLAVKANTYFVTIRNWDLFICLHIERVFFFSLSAGDVWHRKGKSCVSEVFEQYAYGWKYIYSLGIVCD